MAANDVAADSLSRARGAAINQFSIRVLTLPHVGFALLQARFMHTTREVCSANTSRFLRTSRATISTTVERYLYSSHRSRHSPQTVNQDLFPHGATAQPIAQWPFFVALACLSARDSRRFRSLWREPRHRERPQARPRKQRALATRFAFARSGVSHATGSARRRDRESNERSLWRDPRERSPPQRRPRNSRSWHSPTRREKPDR